MGATIWRSGWLRGKTTNPLESVSMTLHLLAVLALGLMCGSELNVAAFAHPMLNRQPLEVHVRMRASLAALFGRVMPFWMAGSALLNLLLLLPFEHLNDSAWRLAAVAFAIQALAVVFSLVGPVPINNRIIKWTPESLPEDWQKQEDRWDQYHWWRTCGLIAAFAILVLSVRAP
ncbi:MAG: DUF1772 domain-containing protein [Candidatus Binatus sp.]|uniref:anthrone oxygenase family protein n=2 Tax=Candidatus Binatus sp. TaxID=2811406 RepID=UPI003BBD4559